MYAPEQNTTAGEFNVNVPVQNEMESVNIKYGHATGPVDDVTISWGNESHNVDFEAEDVIDDHGNEGKDMSFVAYSQDDKWRFIVDVSVGFNYENSGEIYEVHWDTLEIAVDDSKVREGVRKAIKKIIRENFDDRLRAAMGAGEFEKATTPQMPEATKVWDALVKTFSDNKNDSISYLNSDKTYRSIAITAIFRAMNF